jgi:hypothetical protein
VKTRYKFWYAGAWRPVTNLIRDRADVLHPEQANKVVIYLGPEEYLAHTANPGEIFRTDDPDSALPCDWDSI